MLQYNKLPYALVQRIEQNGYEAFFVGGCIRDMFLGLSFKDADITTNAPPEKVKEIFSDKRLLCIGLKHGTVTVVDGGIPYEITTYRTDAGYTDSRHPDSVMFCSRLEDDLKRRDFTVNALAYSPCSGLYDLFSGLSDIESKTIRCIGDAKERFSEDALRILRALRFSSVLNFTIEEQTSKAIHELKRLLLNISGERILEELKKLLQGKNAKKVILNYTDVFETVLPELFRIEGFKDLSASDHKRVLSTAAEFCTDVKVDFALSFSALFSTVAKEVYNIQKKESFSIYDDAAYLSVCALKRLHAGAYEIKTAEKLILSCKDNFEADRLSVKKAIRRYGFDFFEKVIQFRLLLLSCNAGCKNSEKALYETLIELAQSIKENSECVSLKELSVNGYDVMGQGIYGKKTGQALDFLLSAVIEGKVKNNKDELLLYLNSNFT